MVTLRHLWTTKTVRHSLFFVLFLLIVFRVAAHIPVPGVDASVLTDIFSGNQFLGLLNIFSGGTLENFSLVAMGVGPYITASIIFQLLGMIFPSMEEMQKEEQGRRKLNQWTRWLTVPLAFMQAYGLLVIFRQQAGPLADAFVQTEVWTMIFAMLSMTAGTVFLMWLGELISEKKVGNGISILIFAGIVAGLPTSLGQAFSIYDRSQLITALLFVAAAVLTIIGIVVMNEAVRNVPVQYARQVRGARLSGAVSSHIPLRLNMGGVIPIIFAISLILLPSVVARFFLAARSEFLRNAAEWVIQVVQNQTVYGVMYFVLVFVFTYFYTAVIFHPDNMAENLQKQGGFIPGIRPGHPTSEYLGVVANRLLIAGATFLSVIAIMPLVAQQFTGNASLVIGGTSILIVVSGVIECVKQIEAQVSMQHY